jgi:hypothetical protein
VIGNNEDSITSFVNFDPNKMLISWYSSTNRIAETFRIILTAGVINLNEGSPFFA